MRQKGVVKSKVDFYSPDGYRYAMSSSVQQVLQLPFLRIRIDKEHEYHVHNERAFNIHLSVQTPSERRLIDFIRDNYRVDKLKSRTAAQLLGDIIGQI